MINLFKKLCCLLVFVAGFSSASGVDVLFLHVGTGSYDSDGNEIAGYLNSMADVNVTTRYLTTSSATDDIANFDQVWVYDLVSGANNSADQTANYTNISNWYASRPASQQSLILDGRILYSSSANTSGTNGTGVSEQAWIRNYYTQLNTRGGGLVMGTDSDTFALGVNAILSNLGIAGISGTLGSPPYAESVDSASHLQAGYSQINNIGSTGLAPTGHHGIGIIGQSLAGQVLSPVAYRGTLPGSPEDNSTWAALTVSVSSTIGSSTFGTLNIPPILNDGNASLSFSANEDNSTSFTLSALSAVDFDTASGSLNWSVQTAANYGTATVSGSGASPTTFNYAPDANFTGADSFVVQVTDGDSNSTITINVTVNNVNDAPVIAQGTSIAVTMSEDGSPTAWVAPTLSASDADAGDVLTWSAAYLAEGNGTFTVSGTGGSPTFGYVPDANFHGTDGFVVRVTDAVGSFDEITVTITVSSVEDAPLFTFGGGGPTATGQSSENQRSAGVISAAEPDGDTMTFAITGGSDASHFTIDSASGELSFSATPDFEFPADANQDNVYELIVTVTDDGPQQLSDSQTIQMTVTNMIDLSTVIFSSAGAAGRNGPTQQQIDTAYAGTDLAGQITINTQGIQEWTVPFSGMFTIQAWGAQGGTAGSNAGGLGASIAGEFSLTEGDVLHILVGQMGSGDSSSSGGGGGTFLTRSPHNTNASILVIAGGGGGTENSASVYHGLAGNNGGSNGIDSGGTNGSGGANGHGQGAGGFFSGPSGSSGHSGTYPLAYVSGGTGGSDSTPGGFGGGGAGDHLSSGGGGGYSGGSSGGNHNNKGGGGGGSYNSGANSVNQAGVNSGHGKVIVSALNTPPSDVSLLPFSLPENQPANTVVGNFSTVDPDDVNATGTYQYALVSGTGSTDNASFSIDANGTLRTLATFDYEALSADANRTSLAHAQVTGSLTAGAYPANLYLTAQANYPLLSIRVRTTDEFNAFHEKVISVAVLDRDDEIPVITLTGDASLQHQVWRAYQDAGATASDNVDGNVTASIVTVNPVNSDQPAQYVVTYDVTDTAGNVAQQVTRTVNVYNSNPSDVVLTDGSLKENQPIDTLAGQFSSLDPDDPDAVKIYLHTLVDGNGSADNASFVLDLNGTLRSTAIFDFETKDAYQIRVRSTDEFGGYLEEAFVINVVDCFIPVVETLDPLNASSASAQVHGRLNDDGGLNILERGFVIGSQPGPTHGQSGVLSFPGQLSATSGDFQSDATSLSSSLQYFVRAYVINSEGTGYGLEKSFVTTGPVNEPSWIDATPGSATDWWNSAWFGNFFQSANGWVMHEKMGWVYPVKCQSAGMWLWKKGQGWLWTDEGLYPRVYGDSYKSWVYFYGAWEGKKLFYVYNEEQWITSEEE
jgi:VCBS repeat-containing protein